MLKLMPTDMPGFTFVGKPPVAFRIKLAKVYAQVGAPVSAEAVTHGTLRVPLVPEK